MLARLFVGRTTVSMEFGNALIASVCYPELFELSGQLRVFEQSEIMLAPFAERRADNLTAEVIHHNLCFQRVPFLLATVVRARFFFGRSIGVSLTSIKRMFH